MTTFQYLFEPFDDVQLYETVIRYFKQKSVSDIHKFNQVIPLGDRAKTIIVAYKTGEIVGWCAVSIYSTENVQRKNVWDFEDNRERSAWIDRIDSLEKKKGTGRLLIDEAVRWILNNDKLVGITKQNLYVNSFCESIGFYLKCGFKRIYTAGMLMEEFEQSGSKLLARPLKLESALDKEDTYYSQLDQFQKLLQVCYGQHIDEENIFAHAKEIIGAQEIVDVIDAIDISQCQKELQQPLLDVLKSFDWYDEEMFLSSD